MSTDKPKTEATSAEPAPVAELAQENGMRLDTTVGGKHVTGYWPEGAPEPPKPKVEILYPDASSKVEWHAKERGREWSVYVSAAGDLSMTFNPGPLGGQPGA